MAAKTTSKSRPAAAKTRAPLTFEMAQLLCPHQGQAEKIAEAFGLIVPEYEHIRSEHAAAIHRMFEAFGDALNDKAAEMHFQRLTGALVGAAVGAGRFYSEKVSEAKALTARAADGGEEQDAPFGLESKAQRVREFAADMAMQAYAALAAAHGALDAYTGITGDDWKAYEAPPEAGTEKKAASAQIGAFGA